MKRSCSCLLLCLVLGCARFSGKGEEHSLSRQPPPAGAESDATTPSAPVIEEPGEGLAGGVDELLAEYDESASGPAIADPIRPWNVVWFHVNDKIHFWVLKPISTGWRYLLYPRFVRRCIQNMIVNLAFPGRFFNNLLQGRVKRAGSEVGRFFINLTIGVLGLWDPATHRFHMPRYDEDFDQTLGVWGVGMGFYIVWPWFGPSSPRGTVGALGEAVLNPIVNYSIVSLVWRINTLSLDPDAYEAVVRASLDPYTAFRNAYVQNRRSAIER